MSVPVGLEELGLAVAEAGSMALLVTVNEDDRPHAVAVEVRFEGADLRTGAGSRTAANLARRPGASLVWPTLEPGAYSLIVDGTGAVEGDEVVLTPTRGVRHRTPVGSSGADPDAPSCITVLKT